ncbi:hypothetical protein [Lacrimispora brassicae]
MALFMNSNQESRQKYNSEEKSLLQASPGLKICRQKERRKVWIKDLEARRIRAIEDRKISKNFQEKSR